MSHIHEDQPEPSISGPAIVVHHSEVDAPSRPSADRSVFSPESEPPRPQPIQEWSSSSQHSPHLENLTDSTTRSASPVDGLVIPETVTYTLQITFEKEDVPTATSQKSIQLNDASGYQKIEKVAETCVREHFESALAGKSLNFRNGDCTIIGDNNDKHVQQGLSSQEDWKDICTILMIFGHPTGIIITISTSIATILDF